MQQFQVDQAVDDLRFLRTKFTRKLDRASLAERKEIVEAIEIIDAAVHAAAAVGVSENLKFSSEGFTTK